MSRRTAESNKAILAARTATQGACHEEDNSTSRTDPFRARRNDSA